MYKLQILTGGMNIKVYNDTTGDKKRVDDCMLNIDKSSQRFDETLMRMHKII